VFNNAEVAGPPSPEKLLFKKPLPFTAPLPATVVMMPLADTLRIRLLLASAIKRSPELSTATPMGQFNDAEASDGRDDAVSRYLADSRVENVRNEEIPGAIHRDTRRIVQQR
jgi:hypothetical protein